MKNKFFIFLIGLIVLLTFQAKVIMPFVYDVISSGLFLEDSGDEKHRTSTDTPMTSKAFQQCNNYISNELFTEHTFTFSQQPINAFSLGNYEYIINADVEISPADAASFSKRYACRIKYLNKDDLDGVSDLENWSINGLSGLDDI